MKKCKACREEIDSKASKCPKCSTDQRGFFKKHPILTVLLILFIIFLFGATGSDKKGNANQKNASNNDQQLQKEYVKPEVISARDIVMEYDSNKLAADEKYKGKFVQTTAYITNISGGSNLYYLSLKPTDDQYYLGTGFQCFFKEKSDLTSLVKGQSVTVTGTMDAMSLGTVILKNCDVVN